MKARFAAQLAKGAVACMAIGLGAGASVAGEPGAVAAVEVPAAANSRVQMTLMPESQSLALLGLSLTGIGVVRAVRQRRK